MSEQTTTNAMQEIERIASEMKWEVSILLYTGSLVEAVIDHGVVGDRTVPSRDACIGQGKTIAEACDLALSEWNEKHG